MGEFWTQIVGQVRDLADRLSTRQKVVVASVAAVSILGLALMVLWVRHPEYELLFANLTPEDAAKIVEKLKEEGTPYKLERGGAAVLVSSKKVYELRLELASQGLPKSTGVGYEIFDKTNIGMSDFVQKLNYKRGLEGELANSISMLNAVEFARVHIVQPEQQFFSRENPAPQATIILRLKGGRPLPHGSVSAITHLVAGAVADLRPENVVVVDSQGALLAGSHTETEFHGAGSFFDYKSRMESYLSQKAERMLSTVLGPGRATVQVACEVDMKRVERMQEKYDKDVAEEKIINESSSGGGSVGGAVGVGTEGGAASGSASTMKKDTIETKYRPSLMRETTLDAPGAVTLLSVAAFVDLTPPETEEGEEAAAPLVTEAQVQQVIQNAVGFDQERGDTLTVVATAFRSPYDTTGTDEAADQSAKYAFYLKLARNVSVGVLALGAALFAKMLVGAATAPGADVNDALKLAGPEQERAMLRRQISHALESNPEEAKKLFLTWVEEESKA